MAHFVFAMNQSLDGYADHMAMRTGPLLFQHWTEQVRGLSGSIYGRVMYEIMSYWEADQPDWTDAEQAFAAAWRQHPKWVVSRTSPAIGPNATLIEGDLAAALRHLKERLSGEVSVSGPNLAKSVAALGLIDEYRLYIHPLALGHGTPLFAAPSPPLRLLSTKIIAEDVVRLAYAPV